MNPAIRCVIVSSTAGSVMNRALQSPFFKSVVHSVVTDQICPALTVARLHGLAAKAITEDDPEGFCRKLLSYLTENRIDYVFSFYTRFYATDLRHAYRDRLINFHPSLLPAFKGLGAFGDSTAYGVRFVGSTVEIIDEKMDEGKIVLQAACPLDPNQSLAATRHRVFTQQCRALVQVARWLGEDRVQVDGRLVTVAGAAFEPGEYLPNLDFEEAIRLDLLRSPRR